MVNTVTKDLEYRQMLRFSRHIMLPEIEIEGQERLLNSHAVVVGLGGLGSAAAQYLAASGIGKLTLIDGDIVETTNLQRQVLHTECRVGQNKANSAKEALSAINSDLEIETLEIMADDELLKEFPSTPSVILDCSDNLATRNRLNSFCYQNHIPLVCGAAIRFEGQLSIFTMEENTPCYGCLSHLFEEPELSCSESGVFSPLVGIVGAMQACEAIKICAGIGKSKVGQLMTIDTLTMEINTFTLPKQHNCSVCGNKY